uniref:Ig-like domain-containing protein n=1 Tax=Oreochromis aureus TaxID=47969 RepID=A0A668VE28_OREAU
MDCRGRCYSPFISLTVCTKKPSSILLVLQLMLRHLFPDAGHSLKYFYTASSQVPNFPEFVVVGMVDEVQIVQFDSNTMKTVSKQDWMNRNIDEQYWERETGGFVKTVTCVSLYSPVLPSVSLLQKTSSSAISCHATGFYPDRAEMMWRKDGEETHEGVEIGEILTNNDGTFQMRVNLDLRSVPAEDWRRYDCVFQFSGINENVTTTLDKTAIRTNEGKKIIRNDEDVLFVLFCKTGE